MATLKKDAELTEKQLAIQVVIVSGTLLLMVALPNSLKLSVYLDFNNHFFRNLCDQNLLFILFDISQNTILPIKYCLFT